MWTQLVRPKFSTKGMVGWCLKFVEDAYGTPHSQFSARDAWDATHHPHRALPPKDAMVPVYWNYVEKGYNFGHIAINVPGKGVFSSPYLKDNSSQWFDSLEQCAQVLGLGKYLGWSEDLEGVALVKEEEMYKGHSAKYWYEKYQASHKHALDLLRNPAQKVLDAIKKLINK